MTDPMLRGKAAPTGFAADVSGYLRNYVYDRRHVGGGVTNDVRERLNRIDACASLPAGVGDEDPRIRTLALASLGNRWQPGTQQQAVLDSAGQGGSLKPDDFLNALAHAAVVDRAVIQEREIARVKKGTEAAPTHEAMLTYERDRATAAEDRCRTLSEQVEHLRAEVIGEKARRRELQALRGMPLEPVESEPNGHERALPKNVRQRGSRFQGYLKVGGEQRQKMFDTPGEADRWVQEQQQQVERQEIASEAQNRRYDRDLSPEQIAATEERAA